MKLLVVDDEPLAQQRMKQLLQELPEVEAVTLASNGVEAIEVCQQIQPDVVLMDIRMPAMDGLEAAQHIGRLQKAPAVIFTTAYDEYALEAFKVHAVDYLLKPVRQQKLAESLKRACQLNKAQLAALKSQPNAGRSNITARISGNIKLIPVSEVLYFMAEQKYVTVKHLNGETIIEDTLKELQVEFESMFLRVHRNALVAKKYITGIHKDSSGHAFVTLNGDDKMLEISRRHLSAVKKLISQL